jgi:succinate-semialdehyde dehydrogenase/glutarate-semialdehyde dehydrogenase
MQSEGYPETALLIADVWRSGAGGEKHEVRNPATGAVIGLADQAGRADLDELADAAWTGFLAWRDIAAHERCLRLRAAAQRLRDQANAIGRVITLEQGKPLAEAVGEVFYSADIIDWCAEEAKRTYGRVIPSRSPQARQMVLREPIGPVLAITPWNFPMLQAARKLASALAAGCSVVLTGSRSTPATPALLVRAFVDAGVTPGALQLVSGDPQLVSSVLLAHPSIRKLTFTGSTAVGKGLAALAASHMKPATMELGGHAPVLIFDDADLDRAIPELVGYKFMNAGQVCASPTRFLVQEGIHDAFVAKWTEAARGILVGDGLAQGTTMGPLISPARAEAVRALIADAAAAGSPVIRAGEVTETGAFVAPTLLANVPVTALVMNEEPFGPVAAAATFQTVDEAITEANRLPYGLCAYAWTGDLARAARVTREVEAGSVSVNHLNVALPEVPFGGVKDSGYGSEGGAETTDPYLVTKFVSQLA